MASTSIDEDLVEEREELMVSCNIENNSRPTLQKACFLKPCVSSIDGFEGMLCPFPSPELRASSLSVLFLGWKSPKKNFTFWAKKMAALHKPTWLKSGIFEAIEASTYKINKNPLLILSLAHNWCSETNTFVFPWGEATITLEDVNVILGFSVSGSSVFADFKSSEMDEAIEKLENQSTDNKNEALWISSFVDDKMEHEAFLALWLTKFVFPDQTGTSIRNYAIRIAVRLARGERIALAPAVLAILYRDLGKICSSDSTSKVHLKSCLFKLVQVWIWERFKNIRPEAKEIQKGEPRIAQWSGLKQKFKNVGLILFDDNFEWRPYTQPLKNWEPPRFYLEDGKWLSLNVEDNDEFVLFVRCARVSKLVAVGTGSIVENYYPNRVARQFGYAQDFPVLVTNHSSKVTKQEAWDDYNRSLDGLKLYVPSRFATALVTARYQEWWTKLVSEMQKNSNEMLNVGSTVAHFDDDVTGLIKTLPLSKVYKKLEDRMMETNKRCKIACEDNENAETDDDDDNMTIAERMRSNKKYSDVENAKGERSNLQVDNNVSDDDDNMTIAERMRSKRKYSDVENAKGERSSLEVDSNVSDSAKFEVENNVSDLPQKLAFRDETMATKGTEMKHDEKNTANPSNGSDSARLEVENNVSDLPQKLAFGDETMATQGTEMKHDEKNTANPSNGSDSARLEVENNVSDLPQKLAFRDEFMATQGTEMKHDEKNTANPSNGSYSARLEVENNVSDLPQKLAFRDETMATQGTEMKHNEKNTANPSNGSYSARLEVENNVSDLPRNLDFGDETITTQETEKKKKNDEKNTANPSNGVAEQEEDDVVVDETVATQQVTEQKNDENKSSNPSNEVAEQQEEDDVGIDERLKQRKLAIWELAWKVEARLSKVENTLAKIKQWKLGQSHTTPPAST